MGITAFLLIVAIQFAEGNAQQNSLDCLYCQRMAEAHDCQMVKTCNVDEECFTEMYITSEGHIFVDLGCKTKTACDALNKYGRRTLTDPQKRQPDGRITLCQQCCTEPSCNGKACDTYNTTRRKCYTCSGQNAVADPGACESTSTCKAEEQCYNSIGLTNELTLRSELGCMPNQICATISNERNVGSRRSSADQNLPVLFGRSINQSGNLSRIWRQEQGFVHMCTECCNHDYCNKRDCLTGSTPVTDKSIATTTTTVSTARTTTSMPTTTLSTSTTTAPPSTMSMSTASTVTLTTSVASTTPQPSTICIVCSSSGCSNHSCTGATPYCLNILDNNADGNKQETRRCGSELECERDWYNVTALSDICSVYESWQLYALKFSCTYCCVRNYCNRDTNPPRETLYYPQRQ